MSTPCPSASMSAIRHRSPRRRAGCTSVLATTHVLVNNAAGYIDRSETASGADLDAADAVMQVNVYGTWRLTRALLPLLRRSPLPGAVNVSSGAGSHVDPAFGLAACNGGAATYGISKTALNALTTTCATNCLTPPCSSTWSAQDSPQPSPAPNRWDTTGRGQRAASSGPPHSPSTDHEAGSPRRQTSRLVTFQKGAL